MILDVNEWPKELKEKIYSLAYEDRHQHGLVAVTVYIDLVKLALKLVVKDHEGD